MLRVVTVGIASVAAWPESELHTTDSLLLFQHYVESTDVSQDDSETGDAQVVGWNLMEWFLKESASFAKNASPMHQDLVLEKNPDFNADPDDEPQLASLLQRDDPDEPPPETTMEPPEDPETKSANNIRQSGKDEPDPDEPPPPPPETTMEPPEDPEKKSVASLLQRDDPEEPPPETTMEPPEDPPEDPETKSAKNIRQSGGSKKGQDEPDPDEPPPPPETTMEPPEDPETKSVVSLLQRDDPDEQPPEPETTMEPPEDPETKLGKNIRQSGVSKKGKDDPDEPPPEPETTMEPPEDPETKSAKNIRQSGGSKKGQDEPDPDEPPPETTMEPPEDPETKSAKNIRQSGRSKKGQDEPDPDEPPPETTMEPPEDPETKSAKKGQTVKSLNRHNHNDVAQQIRDETIPEANHNLSGTCADWCENDMFVRISGNVSHVRPISSWGMKCTWSNCRACSACADPGIKLLWAHKKKIPLHTCEDWCSNEVFQTRHVNQTITKTFSWDIKCNWNYCGDCSNCKVDHQNTLGVSV